MEAEERKKATQIKNGKTPNKTVTENYGNREDKHSRESASIIGFYVGVSGKTLDKARKNL